MTAIVTLRDLWITRTDDPSQAIVLEGTMTEKQAVAGEVRTLANGRRRIIRRAGQAREFAVSANRVEVATVHLLASWAGEVLTYRDPQGRKVHGTFFEVDAVPWNGHQVASVTFSFTNVTYSEAV
jgi:hypothetical protein